MSSISDLRELLAEIFEAFGAHPLGTDEIPIVRDDGGQSLERETLRGEFNGLTWYSLIVHHRKFDPNFESIWFLTTQALAEALPSYLCACLIWPQVNVDGVIRSLLGNAQHTHSIFVYLHDHFSPKQRIAIKRFLHFVIADDALWSENAFGVDRQSAQLKVDALWSN
jgi:hypothetical protein